MGVSIRQLGALLVALAGGVALLFAAVDSQDFVVLTGAVGFVLSGLLWLEQMWWGWQRQHNGDRAAYVIRQLCFGLAGAVFVSWFVAGGRFSDFLEITTKDETRMINGAAPWLVSLWLILLFLERPGGKRSA